MKFTYGRMYYGCLNLFIHKKVYVFLFSMNLIKEMFLGTIS